MSEKNRTKTGTTRWIKGRSGNPRGRPRGSLNKVTRDISAAARALTLDDPRFVAALQQQLRAGTCHHALVSTLLAYGYGRPVERSVTLELAPYDLTRLDDAELAELERLCEKTRSGAGTGC
jgi:hypothetical protein